jgi:hypothetical protein
VPSPPHFHGLALWGVNLLQSTDFLLAAGLLALVLMGGAVIFWYLDRWRKTQLEVEDPRESTKSLSSYRAMFESGELTREEYEKIRAKLAFKMREQVGLGERALDLAEEEDDGDDDSPQLAKPDGPEKSPEPPKPPT